MAELAYQPHMSTKRRRDDDSDSEDERWLKKARSWGLQRSFGSSGFPPANMMPLQSTPSPLAVPGLGNMTPAQSDHSEADSPASIDQDPLICSSPCHDVDYAMQMDEDDLEDMVTSQPLDTPFMPTNFRPAKLNPDLFGREPPTSNNTGRVPTPIYSSFASSGMNGLGYPSSGMAGGVMLSNGYLGVPNLNPPLMQPPPRKMGAQATDQDRSRRMPSPISEDEDIPDTPTAFAQSQLSRLTVTPTSAGRNALSEQNQLAAADQMMDTDSTSSSLLGSPSSLTPTRGRKRSGALTGSGRFTMGYREDCERCRLRVPGHYSHFLP